MSEHASHPKHKWKDAPADFAVDAVSWCVAPVVASASQICVSYALSSQFVSRTVYTTERPSGDTARPWFGPHVGSPP